jgi:23S rRNA pseudouridine2605 synthase
MAEERLQKILARSGFGSRRACEELIIAGRVLVNGKKAEIGQKADPSKDKIEVDHSKIPQAAAMVYLAYNKPRFMLCDKVQGDERRSVFEMVPGGSELAIVGRLDFESEGLVLLTNDGELVNRLTHPRYEHEKEYKVLVASKPEPKQLDAWRRGLVLEDGHKTSPVQVTIATPLGKGAWLRVTMKEGHKRQIRESAKLLGLFVVRIVRIRIGTIYLGTLKTGEWRELSEVEVNSLKKATTKEAPIRKFRRTFSAKTRETPVKKTKDEPFTKKKESSIRKKKMTG